MTTTQGEAHRVADATATIGTDHYHVDIQAGQRARLAEVAEKTPVTKAVRAGTEIRTTVARA